MVLIFQVSTLDVSSGGLGVSAGDDGSSLFVWETSKGVVRVSLNHCAINRNY